MKHLNRTLDLAVAVSCLVLLTGCPCASQDPLAGETRTFDGIEFQWCPKGSFFMGSPQGEAGRGSQETLHKVTLTKGFWLSTYEITQAQWKNITGGNPSFHAGNNLPVENVSWDDIQGYLALLNVGGTGASYELPTEAQWEYAYRAGTTTRFYWGDDLAETEIVDYAWYTGNSDDRTRRVGHKMPNAWGLYDMSGNVGEWCQDFYGDYPAGPLTDPAGPDSGLTIPGFGETRVQRGGNYHLGPIVHRAAYRAPQIQDNRGTDVGFRLVRSED